MHRIDGPGAVNNLFTEGDPSVPQMATVLTSTWLNDTQENLVRAVEAAGITPVKGDYDQLRQAILLLSGSGEIGEGKLWFSETLPPSGDWLECDGSSLLIVDYPILYAAIGNAFGAALAGYFKLPDTRGIGVRGWDHGRGKDPDAALRTGGDHIGSTQEDQLASHAHYIPGYKASLTALFGGNERILDIDGSPPFGNYTAATGGTETRMKNINVMFIIRWR